MRKTLIFASLFLQACVTVPNKPICVTDAPKHAHCAFMISGSDFSVDNKGQQYTQDGRNWNYDQLVQFSLIMPPDSWAAIKEFILNYCHQNSNHCSYTTVDTTIEKTETKLQWRSKQP